MRIRTVKPEFFTDPDVVVLSHTARLLYVSLWCQADDRGRLEDAPKRLCANAFGEHERINPEKLVAELAAGHEPRILRYEAKGKRFIAIRWFRLHQVPNRPLDSRLPSPDLAEETIPFQGWSRTEYEEWSGSSSGLPPAGRLEQYTGQSVSAHGGTYGGFAEKYTGDSVSAHGGTHLSELGSGTSSGSGSGSGSGREDLNLPADAAEIDVSEALKGLALSVAKPLDDPKPASTNGPNPKPKEWPPTRDHDVQYLLGKLADTDSGWRTLTGPQLGKLQREYGGPVLKVALGRLRESPPDRVGKPLLLIRAVCDAVRGESEAAS